MAMSVASGTRARLRLRVNRRPELLTVAWVADDSPRQD